MQQSNPLQQSDRNEDGQRHLEQMRLVHEDIRAYEKFKDEWDGDLRSLLKHLDCMQSQMKVKVLFLQCRESESVCTSICSI